MLHQSSIISPSSLWAGQQLSLSGLKIRRPLKGTMWELLLLTSAPFHRGLHMLAAVQSSIRGGYITVLRLSGNVGRRRRDKDNEDSWKGSGFAPLCAARFGVKRRATVLAVLMSPLGWGRPAGQQRVLNVQQAWSIFPLTEAEFWATKDEPSSVGETNVWTLTLMRYSRWLTVHIWMVNIEDEIKQVKLAALNRNSHQHFQVKYPIFAKFLMLVCVIDIYVNMSIWPFILPTEIIYHPVPSKYPNFICFTSKTKRKKRFLRIFVILVMMYPIVFDKAVDLLCCKILGYVIY